MSIKRLFQHAFICNLIIQYAKLMFPLQYCSFSYCTHRLGRKRAILVSISLEIITALVASFIDNYYAYATLRFFVGMGVAGSFTTIFVMSKK